MTKQLTHIRVFIASPGGLQDERRAFRAIINEFNEEAALPDGCYFEAVGWEDTLKGIGRPQALINEDLRDCDFCLLLLWDRWGTPPDDSGTYTSGTEEEYNVAMDCHQRGTMRQILIAFKAVDPKQLSDAGPQLAKVLEFKKSLEQGRQHLYESFDSLTLFEKILRRHLQHWLRMVRTGEVPPPKAAALPPVPLTDDALLAAAPAITAPLDSSEALLQAAWQLADESQLTEAETAFARAVVRFQTPAEPLAYGQFLVRQGQLDRATAMFEEAQTLAEAQADHVNVAASYGNLGNVLYTRGDLKGAEQMHRKSLEVNEKLGRLEGMASDYGNLGNVLVTRGDLDGAEQMYRQSLVINEKLGRLEEMATQYGNLGNVLYTHGDLKGAEQMHRHSLEIEERLGRLEGMASDYGNLGSVLYTRGDLDGAEQLYRKSFEINEKLGLLEGMASGYGNLGLVLKTRGDLEGAEKLYRKGLEINEKLGRLEGMANQYGNLGTVLATRGDLDGAEQMNRKGLEINEKLGRLEGMASGYGNLGNVLYTRGDLDSAEQMYRKSLEIANKLGAEPLIAWATKLLEAVRTAAPAPPARKPRQRKKPKP